MARCHLKQSGAECLLNAVAIADDQRGGNDNSHHENAPEEETYLFIAQKMLKPIFESEEIEGETDGRHQHGRYQCVLNQGRVPISDAGLLGGEAAGGGSGEGVACGIEDVHTFEPQQKSGGDGQHDVHAPEIPRHRSGFGVDVGMGHAGGFGEEEQLASDAEAGHQGDCEERDA